MARVYHCFLKNMLEKLGLKVGVFSSPYLIHYTDQISINGESIPEARLEALMVDYQSLLEGKRLPICRGTTEFEIITAIAYDYFASEQVDVAIMEVGMGGLLDSTNVCQPILTGITTIGLDHVALQGYIGSYNRAESWYYKTKSSLGDRSYRSRSLGCD